MVGWLTIAYLIMVIFTWCVGIRQVVQIIEEFEGHLDVNDMLGQVFMKGLLWPFYLGRNK